jgi:hypothetical protein
MKTVFTNSQLAHVWSSGNQKSGRNANSSMFFEGDIIYSYGSHYIIAQKYRDFVLINNTGYSVTTAKHTLDVRRAVTHRTKYYVSTPDNFEKSAIDSANSIYEAYVNLFSKRSNIGWSVNNIISETRSHNAMVLAFNLEKYFIEWPAEMLVDLRLFERAAELREIPRRIEREKREEAERKARELKEQDYLAAWLRGESVMRRTFSIRPQQLRIIGDVVQTTGGAEVPLKEALVLLKALSDKHPSNVLIGQKIGHFEISAINDDIIKIGCHDISISHARQVLEGTRS